MSFSKNNIFFFNIFNNQLIYFKLKCFLFVILKIIQKLTNK